jgi:hypothetical protein
VTTKTDLPQRRREHRVRRGRTGKREKQGKRLKAGDARPFVPQGKLKPGAYMAANESGTGLSLGVADIEDAALKGRRYMAAADSRSTLNSAKHEGQY